MNLGEALKVSWREIRTHKLRSALSFSALSVGAASILYTFGQTHGMRESTFKAIGLMGLGRMSIEAKQGYVSKGLSPGLTAEDAKEIRRAMPELQMVYPKVRRQGAQLAYGAGTIQTRVDGIGTEWCKRDWVYWLRGRFLNETDERGAARVCVVVEPGGWIRKPWWASWWSRDPIETFLDHHDLLGKPIRIEDHAYQVVGVLREPPADLDPRWFHSDKPRVLVPITTYHRYLLLRGTPPQNPTAVDGIEVDTGDERTVPSAKRLIEGILDRRHRGEKDYEIQDNRDMIQEQLSELKKWTVAGTILGAVALLAGGIGIMNVMLATIFSRIKEIGIRRAIGASQADILAQFVLEASLLGLTGACAGILIGLTGISYLARHSEQTIASLMWYHFAAVIAIAVGVSAGFSFYPSWQAAKLDPVEALRND